MLSYVEFPDNEGFGLVHCPHCGATENLQWTIEDNWDCQSCGKEFWITPCRLVTPGIPTFVDDGFERYTPLEITITAVTPNLPLRKPDVDAANVHD